MPIVIKIEKGMKYVGMKYVDIFYVRKNIE